MYKFCIIKTKDFSNIRDKLIKATAFIGSVHQDKAPQAQKLTDPGFSQFGSWRFTARVQEGWVSGEGLLLAWRQLSSCHALTCPLLCVNERTKGEGEFLF